MDFGFSGEIIFIMLLALLLFGPRKLPEIARQIGKFMAEFRRASSDFQNQIREEVRQLDLETVDPSKHLAPVAEEINKAVDSTDDVSLSGALNRLTERLKGTVPQDYDA
jgi:Tat protein translocase TatB subunit